VIASEGRSLVVMGNVHSGAEVAADGDIHVYGKLSGYVFLNQT
jgi:septum formation inhibitor MinC